MGRNDVDALNVPGERGKRPMVLIRRKATDKPPEKLIAAQVAGEESPPPKVPQSPPQIPRNMAIAPVVPEECPGCGARLSPVEKKMGRCMGCGRPIVRQEEPISPENGIITNPDAFVVHI